MTQYQRGIINRFIEFITNRVLCPPIIPLYSTAYTYLTLGSCEHDIGASNANGVSRGKQKGKNFFSFIYHGLDSKRWDFSHSIFSQIQTVPIRTSVCCPLFRRKGHSHIVKNTGSLEKLLIGWPLLGSRSGRLGTGER
jgi:hypothetical protein